MDPENDARIAEFVLRMHRYRNAGEQVSAYLARLCYKCKGVDRTLVRTEVEDIIFKVDGEPLRTDGDVDNLATYEDKKADEGDMEIYVKHDNLLHGKKKNTDKLCSLQFLRKYIHVAKNLTPVLTREASETISNEYAKLRTTDNLVSTNHHPTGNKSKTLPITARALETLIRLSTAHAKARMSKIVEKKDAEAAVELVNFAYFKETLKKSKKRKENDNEETDDDDDEDDPFKFDETDRKRARKDPKPSQASQQDDEETMETDQPATAADPPPVATEGVREKVSAEKLEAFRTFIHEIFSDGHNIDQVRSGGGSP
eukprot:sb/3467006/